jgi:hypothetical protein
MSHDQTHTTKRLPDNRLAARACICPELQSNFARGRTPNIQQESTDEPYH